MFTCLKALRDLEEEGHFRLPPRQLHIVSHWRARRLAEPVPKPEGVPAEAGDWETGEPLLESWESIHDGEDYRLEIDLDASDTFIYDIMLIDEDGDRYIKWDVNLEIIAEVEYTLDDLRFR